MLQLISNHFVESMEQPEPTPIPNGYGTIRLPHLLLHPGLVMTLALVMVLLMSEVVAGADNIKSRVTEAMATMKCISLVCVTANKNAKLKGE